jgi:PAS domain S-box-containing protein
MSMEKHLKKNCFLTLVTPLFVFLPLVFSGCGKSAAQRSNPAIFWLIGALILFFLVILLVLILLRRSRSKGKDLEELVKERTSALSFETSKLQAVIASIPDILFCKDTNYRYTQCNAPFEQFLGVKESEIVGKSDKDGKWFHRNDMKMIHEKEKIVMNENRILVFEERIHSPITGKEKVLETVKAPISQDGVVVGIVAIAHDITWRKEMEDDLAFKTAKLQMIVDTIPDILFCKDADLKYTQCNKPFEKFWGVREADMLGKTDEDSSWFHPDLIQKIHKTELSVMKSDKTVVRELPQLSPITGKRAVFESVLSPLKQNGEVVGILCVARDVTIRKAMEDEIRAALDSRTSFLAHMSHELRTPLNVVIGLTDLIMEDSRLDAYVANNILKINNAGSTLLSIVNSILDFSKIESGKLEITPVEYFTASLLNDVSTVVVTRIGEKPVKFNLDIEADMPERLFGDDLRVKQILINLLTNAVKYTRQGSIELNIRHTREAGTVWMDITVSDTGIGVREDDLKKLFNDYVQVDTKTNRHIEGTGLGLPITKKLVELMHGQIDAESEYGKGTTFRVRLGQGFIDNSILGPDVVNKLRSFQYAEDKRIANKKILRLDLSYARVLVVDDVLTNLDVTASLLHKYRMRVDCLDNGPAAIERIRSGSPVYNAIFMDHMMPDMDGIETADHIRALGTEYAKKIPIIALTANAIHGTEQLFFEHGFQAFVTKPIDMMELDLVIRKWVRDETRDDVPVINAPVYHDYYEQITIEIPGVDTKKGLALYAGDTGVYLALLRSYVTNTPGLLEKLRSVSKETLSKYNVTVHGLKGSSANIGAESIREMAFELEKKSKEGNLQGIWALNGTLIADTKIIIANIKAWLEQYDAAKVKKPVMKAPDRELLKRLRINCENYDIKGADKVLTILESADYEKDGDLIKWAREKIENSDFSEAVRKLKEYE